MSVDQPDHGRQEREDTMGTNVYNSKDKQSLHKSLNSEFILYQRLLKRLLTEKSIEPIAKGGLYNYFKPNDQTDQTVMTEFDTKYQPNKAIYWYTRETCVYRLLNKALRTQNFDDIFVFGSFIHDLFTQLSEVHVPFIKKRESSTFQVYRGQFISKDEVNRMKSGKNQLVAMNSFLSTSTNREKAIEFATSKPPPLDTLTAILLEINVAAEISERPYADIKELSAFPKEEEILFMIGCVFRIDKIWEDEELKLWRATLTLCLNDDDDVKQFSSSIENDLVVGENEFISFGNYLVDMQKFDQAEEHYQKILDNKSTVDPLDLAFCSHGLAHVNNKKGEYDLAIMNLNQALDYLLKNSSTEVHPLVSECYNDCASIYCHQGNYLLAFNYYDKALGTKNNNESITYSGLGQVHFQMGNYQLALEYQLKCLDKHPKTAESLIAGTYIDIGKIHAAMNNQEQASSMFDQAKESQSNALSSEHPDVGYTYSGMGQMFSQTGQEEKAFEYFQKALHIQSQSLPNNHPDLGQSYKNLGQLHLKQRNFDQALISFNQLLENQLKTLSEKHPSVAETYTIIGDIYMEKGDYDQALIYFQKLLNSQSQSKLFGDSSLSATYQTIGNIHLKQHQWDQALIYFHQFLDNEWDRKLVDDPSLAEIYKTISHVYFKKRQLPEALIYANRLLDCRLQKNPIDNSLIDDAYKLIGRIYLKKRHFNQKLLHFNQFLDSRPHANTNTTISNVHFEQRHLDQAENYFLKFLDRQEKLLPQTHPLIIDTYKILGNLYLEKQNLDQALIYFHKLLKHELAIKPSGHRSITNTYEMLGNIYYEKHQLDQALIYFQKLLENQRVKRSSDDPSTADTLAIIAKIHSKTGHLDLALNDYRKALHIYEQALPSTHTTIRKTRHKIHRIAPRLS